MLLIIWSLAAVPVFCNRLKINIMLLMTIYLIPQGSILGPILFVLFINDLPQGVSEDTHLALYADDTKIWRSIRNEEDIVQLQKDINNLHMWSINNKMMFHPES